MHRSVWGWLRRPEPTGGPRIAVAYAVALVAALLGAAPATAVIAELYRTQRICPTDDFACPFVSLFVGIAIASAGLLLLGALLGRLGWRWWLLTCALVLGMFQLVNADATDPAFLLVMVAPLLAALLSDPVDLWRPRVRRWVTVALAVAILLEIGIQIWLAGH